MNGKRVEGIGTVAAVLTTSAWIPQAWKVWKALPQPAESVSLLMYFTISIGIALWIFYGCLIKKWPLIMANVISLVFAAAVLVYKLKYG